MIFCNRKEQKIAKYCKEKAIRKKSEVSMFYPETEFGANYRVSKVFAKYKTFISNLAWR